MITTPKATHDQSTNIFVKFYWCAVDLPLCVIIASMAVTGFTDVDVTQVDWRS